MLGGELRFEDYLRWVRRKQPGHKVSVEAWCKDRFDCKSVQAHPREVRCGFRNAWTDTYTPDDKLRSFMGQVQRTISAGETLDIKLCMHRKMTGGKTQECLKAFTSAEECQECARCPDCCDCKEGR